MNIPQSVLVAADKVMKTDFDRAYVHDSKSALEIHGETTPMEVFRSRLKSRSGANRAVLPDTHPFVEAAEGASCKVGCG